MVEVSESKHYSISREELMAPRSLDAAALREALGLTIAELGSVAGKSPRSAARWIAAEEALPSRGNSARAIRRLARLDFLLTDVIGAEAGRAWLRTPNPGLAGEAPIDLMTSGRLEDVIGVLELLADGGPL